MENVRLNGPPRANDPAELATNLKLLKVMIKTVSKGTDKDKNKIINRMSIEQLPNTISISFKNLKSHIIIAKLSSDVACSAGSACHAVDANAGGGGGGGGEGGGRRGGGGHTKDVISDVLLALQIPSEFAAGTLRLSFGRHTTEEEVDRASKAIAQVVRELLGKTADS